MKRLLLAAAVVLLCSPPAHAADYRAEIERYVVDPCYMELARRMGAPASNRAIIVMLAKQKNTYEIERMKNSVIPAVSGKPWNVRQAVYDFARQRCIRGGRR